MDNGFTTRQMDDPQELQNLMREPRSRWSDGLTDSQLSTWVSGDPHATIGGPEHLIDALKQNVGRFEAAYRQYAQRDDVDADRARLYVGTRNGGSDLCVLLAPDDPSRGPGAVHDVDVYAAMDGGNLGSSPASILYTFS
jgi:hypothetical protein